MLNNFPSRLLALVSTLLVSCWLSVSAQADEIAAFKNTHTYETLRYQEAITGFLPFYKWEKLRTHNSFNTQEYRVDGVEYADPQQDYTLVGQLDMGVRQLNLDVHNVNGVLRLCHWSADDSHLLCSNNDRLFKDGMNEIVTWLLKPENHDEVVVVGYQDEMDGRYGDALAVIKNFEGIIYKPASCGQSLPLNLTRNDILASGKRLVLSLGGGIDCGSDDSVRREWSSFNFSQSKPAGSPGGLTGKVWNDDYTPYPTCLFGNTGPESLQKSKAWISEDRTNFGQTFLPERQLGSRKVGEITDCGLGFQFDSIDVNDDRLQKVIWSWASGEPNNYGEGEHCGQLTSLWGGNNRINDASCGSSAPYACRNETDGSWHITSREGIWQDGFAACREEFGVNHAFSLPNDGWQMRKLQEQKVDAGSESVWIAYTDAHQEGNWLPADNATVYWQQPFAKARWNTGEPNNSGGEHCAVLLENGRLNDTECERSYAAACELAPGIWTLSSPVGWTQAGSACAAAGGSFVMPATQAEMDALHGVSSGSRVWLNYNDIHQEGAWMADAVMPETVAPVVVKDGFFRLKNDENFCLDVEGGDSKVERGRDVEQYNCHGNRDKKSQLWKHYADGTIRPMLNTGLCLDAAGGGTSEGTDILLWTCHGGENQKWVNGTYNSLRLAKATNMTLSISMEGLGKGRDAQLEVYNRKADKRWHWDYDQ
ncbi:ricin-type beta-trefoil lectin domain protein [Parendozoicomonas haliclonae]|uniref:Extracellular exo-alpha-L-arabinofuranosidase n=1 Tax=Parendozoicomonas haliclonae TaxID=1960125 RepID=A0A1X7AI13_9GAMM|nr:ricin-type beta-trefoil lectin domain protein [Parendozoicomonas haliclonae]SMA43970.1 Extracellular exo-alpha-L-arabinofuranosidase precursor [Parendozoicomonas haliclonae]